jgi:NAD-dependent SIR2 family protein deacetylase
MLYLCSRFQGCNGFLANCVINFGDSLEKRVLSTAEDHAKRSDLVFCLGSSLRVSPACDLVEMGQAPVRLVICNRCVDDSAFNASPPVDYSQLKICCEASVIACPYRR